MDHDLQERAENAAVPNDTRQLRACQRCHLVLPLRQFERYRSEGGGETTHGCPNCGEWDDAASMCCVNFTGVAAIVNPEYLAENLVAGCYALEVVGDDDMGGNMSD